MLKKAAYDAIQRTKLEKGGLQVPEVTRALADVARYVEMETHELALACVLMETDEVAPAPRARQNGAGSLDQNLSTIIDYCV